MSPPSFSAPVSFADCAGRLVEFSAPSGPGALLTAATSVLRDAQRAGETTAWITTTASAFFAPDMDRAGVDLDALAVLRVPQLIGGGWGTDVARTGARLLRSGAFGLVVLDMTEARGASSRGRSSQRRRRRLPPALLSRLSSLSRTHDAAALALTTKSRDTASLGPLVSLRAEVRRAGTARPPTRTEDISAPLVIVEIDIIRDRRNPRERILPLEARPPGGLEGLLGCVSGSPANAVEPGPPGRHG